ncbi:MAG: hypothetical protein ACQEQ0_12290 [Bacteroidota bacterium]
MLIELSKNYEVETDPHCWILYRIGKSGPESKKPGEKTRTPIGYYIALSNLLTALPDRVLLNSNAQRLPEAVKELQGIGWELTQLINEIAETKHAH